VFELKVIEIKRKDDLLTVAALGLVAMCVVTFDHEALGHGGACLLLGGHIRLLTSSVFRCDLASPWIDAGGPMLNLIAGALALAARVFIPSRFIKVRFFLILVTAFSFFWEGGYLIHAMHRQDGDLYFFIRSLTGTVTVTERWIGAALGLVLYLATVRLTSRALLTVAPLAANARAIARTAWIAAALGATLAAALGPDWGDLRDAFMEIGLASFPLLLIPRGIHEDPTASSRPTIVRSGAAIVLALVVYGIFAATLGHGLRW